MTNHSTVRPAQTGNRRCGPCAFVSERTTTPQAKKTFTDCSVSFEFNKSSQHQCVATQILVRSAQKPVFSSLPSCVAYRSNWWSPRQALARYAESCPCLLKGTGLNQTSISAAALADGKKPGNLEVVSDDEKYCKTRRCKNKQIAQHKRPGQC